MSDVDNNELVRLAQGGDDKSMETLIRQNERLIWSIVHRFSGRFETEDLYQIGCIGMIKAARRFDLGMGVMFSTYAVPVIMGEIQKFLRDDGIIKVSRSVRQRAVRVAAATEKYVQKHSCAPSVSQLAQLLELKNEEVVEAIAASASPVSIHSGKEDDLSLEQRLSTGECFDEEIADKISVISAAKALPEREKQLITLRYFKSKTQAQAAEILNLSQAQVSRIEKNALEKMRKQLV